MTVQYHAESRYFTDYPADHVLGHPLLGTAAVISRVEQTYYDIGLFLIAEYGHPEFRRLYDISHIHLPAVSSLLDIAQWR